MRLLSGCSYICSRNTCDGLTKSEKLETLARRHLLCRNAKLVTAISPLPDIRGGASFQPFCPTRAGSAHHPLRLRERFIFSEDTVP